MSMQRTSTIICLLGLLPLCSANAQETAGTPFFQKFTSASGEFTLSDSTRIVLEENDQELISRLTAPRGWLDKIRYATGLHDLTIVVNPGSTTAADIVFTKTRDADFNSMIAGTTVTFTHANAGTTVNLTRERVTKDISEYVGAEGFKYKASASGVQVQYKESDGAFWALQSLTRVLMKSSSEAGNHRKLPYGEGIDYPEYEDRRLLVDVGRLYMPVEQIIGLMEKMSLHRMNVLHMHLNDDYREHGTYFTGGNRGVGAFRLENSDTRLRPPDSTSEEPKTYSREDWRKIETAAVRYGIEVIPEFNSPGHAGSWYDILRADGVGFRTGYGHNYRIINTSSSRSRRTAAAFMISLMLSYSDWFTTTDAIHIGAEESFGNSASDVVDYLHRLYDGLKYSTTNQNGYREIEIWIDGTANYGNLSREFKYIQWNSDLSKVPANANWIEMQGTYFIPGAAHANKYGLLVSNNYGWIDQSRANAYVESNKIPSGRGAAVWNDYTQTFYTDQDSWDHVNAGLQTTIPAIGLIGWYGLFHDSSGNKIPYSQLQSSFEGGLIPVSQELSSYWVRDRFPYLSGAQAMTVLLDTQRFRQVWADNAGLPSDSRGRNELRLPPTDAEWARYATVLVTPRAVVNGQTERDENEQRRYGRVRGDKELAWLGWDVTDMNTAFRGPVKFSSGMFVAELAGEGNAMADGRVCRDIGFLLSERSTSACDEDTWSNNISGMGGLVKKGVGKLILSGTNTFLGGILLEGGILGFASAGALGPLNSPLAFAGGTLSFSSAGSLPSGRGIVINSGIGAIGVDSSSSVATINGVISGAGALKKVGAGKLQLRGGNTFSGGLILEAGILEANAAGPLGVGDLIFAGGTLSFGSDYTGSRAASLSMDGVIDSNGNDIIMSGVFSGTGGLVKIGQGSLELRGVNTYRGTIRVAAGTLKADISVLPDASVIRTTVGATVELSMAADGKHDGDIFGSGLIRKFGGNVLTLKGASQANWQIIGGSVVSEGSFTGNVAFGRPRRIFEFRQGSDSSYAGVFRGSGEVIKSGGAALVLTGDSSAFSGEFNIEANSTMFVDGMLGGDVNVKASGVLGGSGKIGGDVMVASSGKLAASRVSGGQLAIGGDLDLEGEYEVNFGAGSTVDGSADISAGTLKVLNGLFSPFNFDNDNTDTDSSQFFVLRSGGALTGPFASVDTSTLPFMRATVVYDTSGTGGTVRLAAGLNDQALTDLLGVLPVEPPPVVVAPPTNPTNPTTRPTSPTNVVAPPAPSLSQVNNNKNLIAVLVDANEQQQEGQKDRVLEEISRAIMMIAMDPEDPQAHMEKRNEILESVAAEVHASTNSALVVYSSDVSAAAAIQTRAAFDTVGSESAQKMRFNLKERKWGMDIMEASPAIWAKGMLSRGINQGGEEFREIESRGETLLMGADAAFSEHVRLGLFAGVSNLEFEQEGATAAGGEDKSRHFGSYGGRRRQNISLRGGFTYTIHEITAHRIALATVMLDSEYVAKTYGSFGELGYQIAIDDYELEPFIGVNYTRHKVEQFAEKQANGSTFSTIDEQSTLMGVLEVGMHASLPFTAPKLPKTRVTGMISWSISLKDPDIIVPQTVGNSQSVDIRGVPVSGDGFSLEAGLDFEMEQNKNVNVAFGYSRLGSGDSANKYSLEGKFTYVF